MNQIEVITEYTYSVFRKFNTFATFKRGAGRKVLWILLAVVGLLCMGAGVTDAVLTNDYSLLAYVGILIIFYIFLLVLMPFITYKGQIASRGLTEHYVFTESNITVTAAGKIGQMNQTFYWEALHSAYETKGFFYLFVARNQGLIVDKSKMQMTEIAALHAMIGDKLGAKFKVR